jgi:hypothetical protein
MQHHACAPVNATITYFPLLYVTTITECKLQTESNNQYISKNAICLNATTCSSVYCHQYSDESAGSILRLAESW